MFFPCPIAAEGQSNFDRKLRSKSLTLGAKSGGAGAGSEGSAASSAAAAAAKPTARLAAALRLRKNNRVKQMTSRDKKAMGAFQMPKKGVK